VLDDIKPPDISPRLRAYIESITAKRAKTVLTHILEHGYITTDELNQLYHYKHPCDLRQFMAILVKQDILHRLVLCS
jgi:hypothetical protein